MTSMGNSASSNWQEVVLVVVGKGKQKFRVHKWLLTSKSPVFKAMFEQSCTREAQENRVDIPDMDADVFDAMLQYLYQEKIPPCMDKLADKLMIVADKYQIDPLKLICEEHLSTKIDIPNAIDLLVLADITNSDHLKSKCIDYVNAHSTNVMQTKNWKQLLNGNNAKLVGDVYQRMVDMKNEAPDVESTDQVTIALTNSETAPINDEKESNFTELIRKQCRAHIRAEQKFARSTSIWGFSLIFLIIVAFAVWAYYGFVTPGWLLLTIAALILIGSLLTLCRIKK